MTDGARSDVEQMLVHNLKTPLSGLMATLEMLGDGDFGPIGPRQRDAVDAMRAQGEEMLALVDELLEVWRMESPGIGARLAPVPLTGLLRHVVAEWSPRLPGRLHVSADEGLPDVIADDLVLHRVLGNLLLNSIVHGGDSVSVRIAVTSVGQTVQLDVEDDGPGIPDGDADRIFEKFARGGPGGAARRGSGLGLAYCRAAMIAQGGQIALHRGGGGGAAFRLVLPASPAPAGAGGRVP
ncbi:MAG TPA: HAMP domain-containing sensor histidine kinase [Gemmatimonadaceae bacterium]